MDVNESDSSARFNASPKRDASPPLKRDHSASSSSIFPVPSGTDLERQAYSPSPSLSGRVSAPGAQRSPTSAEELRRDEGYSPIDTGKSEQKAPLPHEALDLKGKEKGNISPKERGRHFDDAVLASEQGERDDIYIKLSPKRQKLYDTFLEELVSQRASQHMEERGAEFKNRNLYLDPSERQEVLMYFQNSSDEKLKHLLRDMKIEMGRLSGSSSEVTTTHLLRTMQKVWKNPL